MNKKGFSDVDLLNIIKVVAAVVLFYLIYKTIMSQFGGG